MLQRKILSLSNLSLIKSETIFSRKIIPGRKKQIIVMNLYLAIFRLFVVQWSAKLLGCQPQLKPLYPDSKQLNPVKDKLLLTFYMQRHHPDLFWQNLNVMSTQKNPPKKLLCFPIQISCKNQNEIVHKNFQKKFFFSRDKNIFPKMCQMQQIIFRPSFLPQGSFRYQ